LRDKNGNILADLRGNNRSDNNVDTQAPNILKENRKPVSIETEMNATDSLKTSYTNPILGVNLVTPRVNNDEPNSFARGGHGIFGEAKVKKK
jgi:hypothetical protein